MRTYPFGFSGSSLTRLALGAMFCVGAGGLVWAVERPRAAVGPVVTPTPGEVPMAVVLPLVVESTYQVAHWRIAVDGVQVEARQSDGWSWTGSVPGHSGGEVLVVATAAAADAQAPHGCLRLRLGQSAPTVAWGGGEITVTLVIP